MGQVQATTPQTGAPTGGDLYWGNLAQNNSSPNFSGFQSMYPNYTAWNPQQPAAAPLAPSPDRFSGASPAPTPWNASLYGSR